MVSTGVSTELFVTFVFTIYTVHKDCIQLSSDNTAIIGVYERGKLDGLLEWD